MKVRSGLLTVAAPVPVAAGAAVSSIFRARALAVLAADFSHP